MPWGFFQLTGKPHYLLNFFILVEHLRARQNRSKGWLGPGDRSCLLPCLSNLNICKPITCQLASNLSGAAFPEGQSQCCQIHSRANFSNPKCRIHPSGIEHDQNFFTSSFTYEYSKELCVYFCCQNSWEHRDHHFPPCLQAQRITSTVCHSPADMYLSWQFGLKFPLLVYKGQPEIPSEIKTWWPVGFIFILGVSFGGRFLQAAHSVISIFPQNQLLLLPTLWNVLS